MCLVVFAWRAHPDYRLVLGANRDEFHARPAAPLGWWTEEPGIVGGRDLQAGGTWLALTRSGRFATVTNYREDLRPQPGLRSRGELVTRFLTGSGSALDYASALDHEAYAGFSLLAGRLDGEAPELAYTSNRGDAARALAPGVYGLSNASLDTPWTKVLRSKARLETLLDHNRRAGLENDMRAERQDNSSAPRDNRSAQRQNRGSAERQGNRSAQRQNRGSAERQGNRSAQRQNSGSAGVDDDRNAELQGKISADAVFAMLADREPGSSEDIADVIADDLPEPTVRAIAAPFVVTPAYGTRCSTVVLVRTNGTASVHERRFDPAGTATGDTRIDFDLDLQERALRAT